MRSHEEPGSYLLSDVDEQLLLNISVSLVLHRVQEPSQAMPAVPPDGQNKGSEGTKSRTIPRAIGRKGPCQPAIDWVRRRAGFRGTGGSPNDSII